MNHRDKPGGGKRVKQDGLRPPIAGLDHGLALLPGDVVHPQRGKVTGNAELTRNAPATETAAVRAAAIDTSIDQPGGASVFARWGRRLKQRTWSRRARLSVAAGVAALCVIIVVIVVERPREDDASARLVTRLEDLSGSGAVPVGSGGSQEARAGGEAVVEGVMESPPSDAASSSAPTVEAADNVAAAPTSSAVLPVGELVNESGTRLLHTWSPGGSRVLDVAVSPDGKLVATANENKSASVWDVSTGELVDSIRDFESAVLCVAFSPDGQHLATGTSNQSPSQRGVASLWSTSTWRREAFFSDSKAMRSLAFIPNGTRVIAGLGSSVPEASVVQMETSFRQMQERMKTQTAAQGKTARSSFAGRGFKMWQWGGLAIYDRASDKSLPTPELDTSRIVEVAMSPDGKQFVTCGFRGELTLRDAGTGEPLIDLLSLAGNPGGSSSSTTAAAVHAVAFAPIGSLVAAGSPDGFVVYDVSARREVLRNSTAGETLAVQFSPDGRLLATGHERQPIQLWDAASGERRQTIPVSWQRTLDIEFLPDARGLVAGGESPGEARVWALR